MEGVFGMVMVCACGEVYETIARCCVSKIHWFFIFRQNGLARIFKISTLSVGRVAPSLLVQCFDSVGHAVHERFEVFFVFLVPEILQSGLHGLP